MNDIDQLFNLQEVNQSISRQTKAKSAIIETLISKKEHIFELDREIKKAEELKLDLKKKLVKIELEVKNLNARLQSEENKVNIVRNPKEYESLMNNIHSIRTKADDLEMIELEVIDQIEQNAEHLEQLSEKRTAEFEALRDYSSRSREDIEKIDRELADLEDHKNQLKETISKSNLQHYERLFDQNGCGVAIVDTDGICSNCSLDVVVNKIRTISNGSGQVVKCSNCERFLYWTGPVDE